MKQIAMMNQMRTRRTAVSVGLPTAVGKLRITKEFEGSVAEWSTRGTRNSAVLCSSPALTTT